jgi:hypothetical protein
METSNVHACACYGALAGRRQPGNSVMPAGREAVQCSDNVPVLTIKMLKHLGRRLVPFS